MDRGPLDRHLPAHLVHTHISTAQSESISAACPWRGESSDTDRARVDNRLESIARRCPHSERLGRDDPRGSRMARITNRRNVLTHSNAAMAMLLSTGTRCVAQVGRVGKWRKLSSTGLQAGRCAAHARNRHPLSPGERKKFCSRLEYLQRLYVHQASAETLAGSVAPRRTTHNWAVGETRDDTYCFAPCLRGWGGRRDGAAPAPAQAGPFPSRSLLPWASGCATDELLPTAFEQYRGRPVDVRTLFWQRASWAGMEKLDGLRNKLYPRGSLNKEATVITYYLFPDQESPKTGGAVIWQNAVSGM